MVVLMRKTIYCAFKSGVVFNVLRIILFVEMDVMIWMLAVVRSVLILLSVQMVFPIKSSTAETGALTIQPAFTVMPMVINGVIIPAIINAVGMGVGLMQRDVQPALVRHQKPAVRVI